MAVQMLLLLPGEAAAAPVSQRNYELGGHGTLSLAVPAGWDERTGQRDARTPPTIAYRPRTGPPFDVRFTPIWPPGPEARLPDAAQVRQRVQQAADAVRGQAVENPITLVELKGPAAGGYYFRATDRAPKPGEFKYIAQGMLSAGRIAIAFTVLSNDGQEDVVRSALEMLRNARVAPPKAAPRPARGAAAPPPPDRDALQAFLRAGEYAKLDAALYVYQDAYREGAINDEVASEAFVALRDNDPELRERYDAWVQALPESYVARVARGYYLMRLGYLARGTAYARETPEARMKDMRAQFDLAMADLERSLKLDARPTLSYGTMISIARSAGARREAAGFLAAAESFDRRVYTARSSYFTSLLPHWGGSLQAMEAALASWKGLLEDSQWQRLEARLEDARSRATLEPIAQMARNKQCPRAIAEYSKVLEHKPVPRAYGMRGYCYLELGQHAKALEDFDRLLAIDPEANCCSGTRANRASALLKLGRKDEALVDLLAAADDDNPWAIRELGKIYAFGKYGFKRDYAAARRYCEHAAKQGDPLSMYCVGGIYHAGLGVEKDLPLAAYWFANAGLRGIADAQTDIGIMCWEGLGVPQDRRRAAQWWRMAAAQGNARAAGRLQQHGLHWSYFRYVTLREWLGR